MSHAFMVVAAAATLALGVAGGVMAAAAPAPAPAPAAPKGGAPDFGPNVLIFDPSTAGRQQQINAVFAKQERNQFGSERYALLFKPGKYDLDVQVGFYMQVLGLGQSPDDVAITGAVRSHAKWFNGNATQNFWRTVENLSVTPTMDNATNMWAVSQGASFRRVHMKGSLNLADRSWSSGGFLADCRVDGRVSSGSRQQWFSRNDQWASWDGGNWNMVFVGVTNPPSSGWPQKPYTIVDKTPVIREKPFLSVDSSGHYRVIVPALNTTGSAGVSWAETVPAETAIPIEQFYIAHAGTDKEATINAALAQGKHLILTPGVYHLDGSIKITRAGTVVLGLGFPTLIPDKGTPAMAVADVDGVKIAGVLFDASAVNSPALLQVGEPGSSASHAADPTFLYDIFCRAGGMAPGMTDCMVTIHSNDVVGDCFWLWRADHGKGVGWTVNKNANGLIVNGNNVIMYGLFVEHCQEYQTIWNGNGGRCYFYQSEMPYDPPGQGWGHNGVAGWASYKVGEKVTTHEAWGLGVYSAFRSGAIAENAIETPVGPGIRIHHPMTVKLGGGRGIAHVINGQGSGGRGGRATVD